MTKALIIAGLACTVLAYLLPRERNELVLTDVQKARYLWFQNKRVYFSWQELNDIRRERGLGPVPIDGYVPGVDRPGKMEKWYD